MSRLGAGIKRHSVRLLSFLLLHSGVLSVLRGLSNRWGRAGGRGPLVRRRQRNNFQILIYHRVSDRMDPYLPATPAALFRVHMQYLAENATVCSLDQAVESMLHDELPNNVVAITLDDGYRDNYTNVFPILKDLSLTATIFLTTGAIGTRRILWHDRVFRAFSLASVARLERFGPQEKTYELGTPRERARSQVELLELLKPLPEQERSSWIDRLIERFEVDDPREDPGLMLGWDEVREMHRAGISFGSHTVSHPVLTALPAERVREELTRSKAQIERELGAPIASFAYPNGKRRDFNEATKQIVREAGYTCAVTTIFGANGSEPDPDLMELRRDTIGAATRHEFATRMTFYKFAS